MNFFCRTDKRKEMNFHSGGELFHYLDMEGAFSDETAQFYAANVILALQHLHSQGIVYRDLKPENLLIDQQGYIKVADFGSLRSGLAARRHSPYVARLITRWVWTLPSVLKDSLDALRQCLALM